jgi:hypothetical protein
MKPDLLMYLCGLLSGMCALRIVQLAGPDHLWARLIVISIILVCAWMLHQFSRSAP